jgi:hypothetical protein
MRAPAAPRREPDGFRPAAIPQAVRVWPPSGDKSTKRLM